MNLGFKIHSFDNANSVPWEYYPTCVDCEVGSIMSQGIVAGNTVVIPNTTPGDLTAGNLPFYICMTKVSGLWKQNKSAQPENYKFKDVAVVAIRNDMILEGVRVGPGSAGDANIVFLYAIQDDEYKVNWMLRGDTSAEANTSSTAWQFKELSSEPLGIEIYGQPAYKVLVRYIG